MQIRVGAPPTRSMSRDGPQGGVDVPEETPDGDWKLSARCTGVGRLECSWLGSAAWLIPAADLGALSLPGRLPCVCPSGLSTRRWEGVE